MKPEGQVDLEGITFDCNCPKCGHEAQRTAAFIRLYDEFVCPECTTIVPIVERAEILKALIVGEQVIELAREIRKQKAATETGRRREDPA